MRIRLTIDDFDLIELNEASPPRVWPSYTTSA
jgi:hypothetical protein